MRIRKKGVKGAKRWGKRESCISNPTTFKYRKGLSGHQEPQYYGQKSSVANLPLESIANSDNSLCGSMENLSVISERFVMGTGTSQLEKDAGAIFAAITEIIRNENGRETVTEYIAAMITYLGNVEDVQELNASMYLISKMINSVPKAVLNKKFSEISQLFMTILSEHAGSENGVLLQNIIRCLAVLLREQEATAWNNSVIVPIYSTILNAAIDSRPKVRKIAQTAVSEILERGTCKFDSKVRHHPAEITAEFCLEELRKYGAPKDQNNVLYALGIVKFTLPFLPSQRVKSICESLLDLMIVGNTTVKTCCLQTLHQFFFARPKAETFSSTLTAKLINALYQYVPATSDVILWKLWLPVMKEAHFHLYGLDENLCLQHLPFLFQTAVNAWRCDVLEIRIAVMDCLKTVLYSIIEPLKERLLSESFVLDSVKKCFELVEGALKFQFHASWNQILLVMSVFYEVAGLHGYAFMAESLGSLSKLCESEDFSCCNEAKYALGSAVRTMGPQKVLKVIPLELDLSIPQFCHTWMIPLLQQNIRHADFAYFVSKLLPLTELIQKEVLAATENNDSSREKKLIDMELQIWGLLPGFCTQSINVPENFRKVARLFGTLLSTRPNLRLHVLCGIRTLINQNDDEITSVMSRFSKNYMPIFFNLYTSQVSEEFNVGERMAVFETLKVYVKIAESEVIDSLYEKLMGKLNDCETENIRHALLDLILGLLPRFSLDQIKEMYNLLSFYVESGDATVRKKVFRIVEDLCACQTEPCEKFVAASLPGLKNFLGATLSSAPPATKAARLRCLKNLLSRLSSKHKNYAIKLLPEAVMCVKEPSSKARSAALSLVIEIGNYYLRISQNQKQGFKDFIQLIMAGLASSPVMISATILVLGNTVRHFQEFTVNDLQPIIDCACALVQYPNRQVVDSALLLQKSILATFSEADLFEHAEKITTSLSSMPDDIKRPFRFKTKEVLVKLIKKFGYLSVLKFLPEDLKGIVKKINKDLIRQKRRKAEKDSAKCDILEPLQQKKSQDDLLDSEEESNEGAEANSTKSNKLWLREKSDAEVVNFLEPTAFKNISATKHMPNSNLKKDFGGFRMSEDGKLIIVEDEDDETSKPLKRKHEDVDDVGEDDDLGESSSEDGDNKSAAYHAGGIGIHRPVGSKKTLIKPNPNKRVKNKEEKSGRKDNVQPFKYMPLSSLSNRKKKNNVDSLVRSAKKGSKVGRLKNIRSKKHKK